MNCDLRIGSKCKGEKYHGETCGRLRPAICDEKARFEKMLKLKKAMVESSIAVEKEMGMGA